MSTINMAKMDAFNSFMMERFSGIAGDIFHFVQTVVLEQHDEIKRLKEENHNLRIMLAEASANKGNAETDIQTSHPEGPTLEQQNSNYEPRDTSLIRVKLELSALQSDTDPELLTEASTRIAPSPKKTDTDKATLCFPMKPRESEGLKMNSYLTINLLPCDAQLNHDNVNSNTVRIESTSSDCERGVKGVHSCPYCNKSFKDISLLTLHLDSNRCAPYPFYCQTCGRHFKSRVTLRNHMIVHQKLRRFRCQFCGKGFHHNGHLKEHVRIHTGEKPYSCSVCGKRFTQFNHVGVHVRNHHQGQSLPLEKMKR